MNILMSVFKFVIGTATLSYNVFSLKNSLAAVSINTIIAFILLLILFYYPVGGWLGIITHLFFLYVGAIYVYVWDKITDNPNLKIASVETAEVTSVERSDNEVQIGEGKELNEV